MWSAIFIFSTLLISGQAGAVPICDRLYHQFFARALKIEVSEEALVENTPVAVQRAFPHIVARRQDTNFYKYRILVKAEGGGHAIDLLIPVALGKRKAEKLRMAMAKIASRMPRRNADVVNEVVIHNHPSKWDEYWMEKNPGFKEAQGFAFAAADPNSKTIHFFEGSIEQLLKGAKNPIWGFRHEMGHLAARKYFGGVVPPAAWAEAMMKDGNMIEKYSAHLDYEDFADAFSLYVRTRGGAWAGNADEAEVRLKFRHRFEFLDRLFAPKKSDRLKPHPGYGPVEKESYELKRGWERVSWE